MKNIKCVIIMLLAFVVLISATSCGNASNVTIDVGKSSIYSEAEINDAATEVKKYFFKNFDGCVLHSLTYAGDELCKSELSYCNVLKSSEHKDFVDCIVFNSSFQSPVDGGDAWIADEEYTYSWHLARTDGGAWEYVTCGY